MLGLKPGSQVRKGHRRALDDLPNFGLQGRVAQIGTPGDPHDPERSVALSQEVLARIRK